jgi:hypothetical protein
MQQAPQPANFELCSSPQIENKSQQDTPKQTPAGLMKTKTISRSGLLAKACIVMQHTIPILHIRYAIFIRIPRIRLKSVQTIQLIITRRADGMQRYLYEIRVPLPLPGVVFARLEFFLGAIDTIAKVLSA